MRTLIILACVLYFVPTIIAWIRDHQNKIAITALNILLGWSVIGWVGSLIWSLVKSKPQTIQIVRERD